MAVVASGGREAITHYRVSEPTGQRGKRRWPPLLDCRLYNRRTHQIRVHMAAIGHPLIGDRSYGAGYATKAALCRAGARLAEAFPRQALHAWLLGFEHPVTGESLRFERPPPADFPPTSGTLSRRLNYCDGLLTELIAGRRVSDKMYLYIDCPVPFSDAGPGRRNRPGDRDSPGKGRSRPALA